MSPAFPPLEGGLDFSIGETWTTIAQRLRRREETGPEAAVRLGPVPE